MSPLKFANTGKRTTYSDLAFKLPQREFRTILKCSKDSVAANEHGAFDNISNTIPLQQDPKPVLNTSLDDTVVFLTSCRSDVAFYPHCMSDNFPQKILHDIPPCAHVRQAQNNRLRSAVTHLLGSNASALQECRPINAMTQNVEHEPASGWLCEQALSHPHNLTSLVPPDLGPMYHKPVIIGATAVISLNPDAEGCITTTAIPPAPGADAVISGVTVSSIYDDTLIKALADWTSQWLYVLIVRPHVRQGFNFQYHGKPDQMCAWVARRLCPALRQMYNPAHIVIHALLFIATLGSGSQHHFQYEPFSSIPFFQYLSDHGTYTAEDFMFRAFVICAMIGDKAVNDVTFTTRSWKRLTGLPGTTLNTLEKVVLALLQWNVIITDIQWQETLNLMRECLKKSDRFGPIAHLLNELAIQSGADVLVQIISPQPIRASTQWQLYIPPEWCPEDDPIVNHIPRTIGIAPGANEHVTALQKGTTAKDLLDMILGSTGVSDYAHLGRSLGTSFYGSLGAAATAQPAKLASGDPAGSWIFEVQEAQG